MQSADRKSLLAEYGTAIVLTAGIFILDLLTAAEVAVWLLYAIPLTLTMRSSRVHAPLYFTSVVTLLLGAGYVIPPPASGLGMPS